MPPISPSDVPEQELSGERQEPEPQESERQEQESQEPQLGKQKSGLLRTSVRSALRLLNPLFYLKHRKYIAIGGAVASFGAAFLYSDGAAIRLAAESAVRYTAAARQFVREIGEPSPASLLKNAHEHQEDLGRMVSVYRTELEGGRYDTELAALEKEVLGTAETLYALLSSETLAELAGTRMRECAERAYAVVDAAKARADARLLVGGCSAHEKKLADMLVEAEQFDPVVAGPDKSEALIEKLRGTIAESGECVRGAGRVLGVASAVGSASFDSASVDSALAGYGSAGVSASASVSAPMRAAGEQETGVIAETVASAATATPDAALSCFSTVLQRYLSRIAPEDAYRIVLDPAVHMLRSQYSADELAARNTTIALETIAVLPEEGLYEIARRTENRMSPDAKIQRFRGYADDVAGLPRDARHDVINYLVQRECEAAPERCPLLAGSPLARATPEQVALLISAYAQKRDPAEQRALQAHLDGVQRTLAASIASAPPADSVYSSSSRYAPAVPSVPGQRDSNRGPKPIDPEDQPHAYANENRRFIPDSELEPGPLQRVVNKFFTN